MASLRTHNTRARRRQDARRTLTFSPSAFRHPIPPRVLAWPDRPSANHDLALVKTAEQARAMIVPHNSPRPFG